MSERRERVARLLEADRLAREDAWVDRLVDVPRLGPARAVPLAESLGAVESLIEQPAVMTHLSVAGSDLDVDPALIRLSVGLETIDDLLADLDQALAG